MTRELTTIQKREKLNDIWVMDEKGNGGANHHYTIHPNFEEGEEDRVILLADIQFQNGSRKEEDSIHGVIDVDLLEMN